MARNIVIEPLSAKYIEKQDVEIVERKGIGHPDSIAGGLWFMGAWLFGAVYCAAFWIIGSWFGPRRRAREKGRPQPGCSTVSAEGAPSAEP